MSEKDTHEKNQYDLMQDTQYLLRGENHADSDSYSLEDILAEFGEKEKKIQKIEKSQLHAAEKNKISRENVISSSVLKSSEHSEKSHLPHRESQRRIIEFPTAVQMGKKLKTTGTALTEKSLTEDSFETSRNMLGEQKSSAVPNAVAHEERLHHTQQKKVLSSNKRTEFSEHGRQDQQTKERKEHDQHAAKSVSMEDIVANTVDAVKAEREKYQDRLRRRIEKERKKQETKRKEPRVHPPLPETSREQPLKGIVLFHKRRYRECRKSLIVALPVLILMWLPWFLVEFGVSVPYFSNGAGNEAVYVLIMQMILCVVSSPLFRAAREEWKDRCCTVYSYTAIANFVSILDEITLLALPRRSNVAPLGGVASCTLIFALWGLKNYHRGMWESFRTAAMGEPTNVVDCCEIGIVKGKGRREGFVTRANMESTASQWQRLLLPVLLAATFVFALLSSVGRERGQDFLWCWSVMLSASCSVVCPLSYCVPFGRIARKLSRSGAAVAGQYGASALASSSKLVATDVDLFPRDCVASGGVKLYGEERVQAISYAATLVVQNGGCLARVFEHICQTEQIQYQPLEHFHVHDDNGLSGMIRGETVLVGTPMFMRHKAVRLPQTIPSKTAVCLVVDGELVAVFPIKYSASPAVEVAMRAFSRNHLQLMLATRDGNIAPKMLKKIFKADGKAVLLETSERLSFSDPKREGGAPNALLYRDGFLPF
ncbi:MAG: hypothetical protein IKC03_03815, partial [Oscillospiraceae bacterium]|nr:hypothetical protein [Oscillospiraceae bacterium]